MWTRLLNFFFFFFGGGGEFLWVGFRESVQMDSKQKFRQKARDKENPQRVFLLLITTTVKVFWPPR